MDFGTKEIKEQLYKMYWEDKMSMTDIAKELGVPRTTLTEKFKVYKIERRKMKDVQKLNWKKLWKHRMTDKRRNAPFYREMKNF